MIHAVLLAEHGGSEGVRDMGAIESAVARPQSGYYEDAVAEAAALMESLMMNHGFVDGNKRVAVAAADVSLRLNGHYLAADPIDAYDFIDSLFAARDVRLDRIEPWLRENSEALPGAGAEL